MRWRSTIIAVLFVAVWMTATAGLSYVVFTERNNIRNIHDETQANIASVIHETTNAIERSIHTAQQKTSTFFKKRADGIKDMIASLLTVQPPQKHAEGMRPGFINASYNGMPPPPSPRTLSDIKKRVEGKEQAERYAQIIPAAGPAAPMWLPEQPDLEIEAVLAPRRVTVISSSQDGRIAEIPVNHGDHFKKGDLLVAYDCAGLRAEADIAKVEKGFTEKRRQGTDKLFKLDIISDLDRVGAQTEDQKADIKNSLYQSRLKDCDIRAEFDGHVTNRLANPGEYTRTDRVLLEIASNETLQAEFLVPSKWLRWVNIGAPVTITVTETERSYSAKIERIHGEVDPVSQSIQMIATLDPYQDPLLPGMSGKARINIDSIRNAGIRGYLEIGKSPENH